MALLQTVADKLVAESARRRTHLNNALEFAKRVNWLCAEIPLALLFLVQCWVAQLVGRLLPLLVLLAGSAKPKAYGLRTLKDPTRREWHEVTKMTHYRAEVSL